MATSKKSAAKPKAASAPLNGGGKLKEVECTVNVFNGQPDSDKELCKEIHALRMNGTLKAGEEISVKLPSTGEEVYGTCDIQEYPEIPAQGKKGSVIINFTRTR